ncbi:ATP-grasp domain-containing protein [Rubinisphaera margarita]|uniref:ATP-grasp domain-containing protein n=1 Tax=Rubinisphaera margarita TaxID=2909586 RepID=UPI001EE88ECA|nr:RimK family alpha-L-glutamate ligase [Rubinisphaera margarita]MCG6156770.1 RimK family alpha-L-glutamate ligase [Rubinisphaera margarita]
MRVLVLGQPESYFNRQLFAASHGRGHDCDVFTLDQLRCRLSTGSISVCTLSENDPPRQLTDYDVCLVRAMPPGSLEQVIWRMDLLWTLEQQGVRVINPPKAIECAIDKFLTLSRCAAAGLSVPESISCETAEEALVAFEELGRDVVAKPLFGAEGRGMIRVTDLETARRVFQAWEQIGAVLFVQKFLSEAREDLRVMMIGGQPLGAIRRSAVNDFRTNAAQEGIAHPHDLESHEAELARAACEATGVVFGGVDLMYDADGILRILEVNACPGWKSFEKTTGISVPQNLFTWLET